MVFVTELCRLVVANPFAHFDLIELSSHFHVRTNIGNGTCFIKFLHKYEI